MATPEQFTNLAFGPGGQSGWFPSGQTGWNAPMGSGPEDNPVSNSPIYGLSGPANPPAGYNWAQPTPVNGGGFFTDLKEFLSNPAVMASLAFTGANTFAPGGFGGATGAEGFPEINWGMEDTATWPGSDTFAEAFPPGSSGEGGAPVEARDLSGLPPADPYSPNFMNRAAGAPSWLSKAASGITGGVSTPWGIAKSAFDIGSGVYGLTQQQKQRRLAEQAFAMFKNSADPYAAVRDLMANPGSVTGMPGYQFGMDEGRRAIARTGAASGGGGNEAIAAARYTPEYAQKFYESEISRRMQLGSGQAGAGVNAAQVGNQALTGANALTSASLGSIGYGAARLGGAPDPSTQVAQLLQRMFRGG